MNVVFISSARQEKIQYKQSGLPTQHQQAISHRNQNLRSRRNRIYLADSNDTQHLRHDESGRLANTLNTLSVRIRNHIHTPTLERNEKKTVLEPIVEGIEDLEHIFVRFFRVDKSRAKKIGGTGLGLSIVETIIEKHFGRISVESKLGEGTTFTVFLPTAR